MVDKFLYTEIPAIRVSRGDRPVLYEHLSKMGRTQAQMALLDALEQVLVPTNENANESANEDNDIFGSFTLPPIQVSRSTRPALYVYLLQQARVMGMELKEVTEYVLDALEKSMAIDAQSRDEYTLLAILAEIRALREEGEGDMVRHYKPIRDLSLLTEKWDKLNDQYTALQGENIRLQEEQDIAWTEVSRIRDILRSVVPDAQCDRVDLPGVVGAKIERFKRLLLQLEWVQLPHSISVTTPPFCPMCKAWKREGHKTGCDLDKLLRREP